ncbi:hypothetical protein BC826DRAFT_970249 [Russula brevipes]|nr:hypothetical protein BC826DRAFT_970249 [Russula brevipes]
MQCISQFSHCAGQFPASPHLYRMLSDGLSFSYSKARPSSSLCSDLECIPIITPRHPWIHGSDDWPISRTSNSRAFRTSQGRDWWLGSAYVLYAVSMRTTDQSTEGQVTIDILPDDVLLEIFEIDTVNEGIHRWHKLVHVCRRWRTVVFASPHRLNLRLRCKYKTPVRKMLDIWPVLPIIIEDDSNGFMHAEGADNIVAALEHPGRVCRIRLWDTPKSDLDRFTAAMTEPFPELTFLHLRTRKRNTVPALPDSFLGGSAPRLQVLYFKGISFPAIPKLLSSTSDLVELRLLDIPHSGYISPEAMVTGISALTRLELLHIGFESPRSRPDQPSPPRSIRTVLPALIVFQFRGVSEYLEDLTSRIDAPLLGDLEITFFNQLIFNTPRLSSFISHAEKLRSQSQAGMALMFGHDTVGLSLTTTGHSDVILGIRCDASDWQLSSLTQVCGSPFLSFFNLERLEICENSSSQSHWEGDVENIQWLDLLRPFTTVKRLSISDEFTPRVVPALVELLGERIMDVLPALQSISLLEASLSGPVKEAFAQFVAARQVSGHPVTVHPQGEE